MDERERPSHGVQELITRLRDEGVDAGRQEAQRLVEAARRDAAAIVAAAQAEAEAVTRDAAARAERERRAGLAALNVAARDALIRVREELEQHFVRRLREVVTSLLMEPRSLGELASAAARAAVDQAALPRAAELEAGENLARGTLDALVATLMRDVLSEGVSIGAASVGRTGIRLRFANSGVELELTESAVTELLADQLLPRFRTLLERGVSGGA